LFVSSFVMREIKFASRKSCRFRPSSFTFRWNTWFWGVVWAIGNTLGRDKRRDKFFVWDRDTTQPKLACNQEGRHSLEPYCNATCVLLSFVCLRFVVPKDEETLMSRHVICSSTRRIHFQQLRAIGTSSTLYYGLTKSVNMPNTICTRHQLLNLELNNEIINQRKKKKKINKLVGNAVKLHGSWAHFNSF